MRYARLVLLLGLLAVVLVLLGGAPRAHAYTWSTVTIDSEGDVGGLSSIAVDANGHPMISYRRADAGLKFAICDPSASANGNCDEPGDWSKETVDTEQHAGSWTSIAVDANGDPMISHFDLGNWELRFAICDRSESANGNCDEAADWSSVTIEAGDVGREGTSIALDANGDPVMAYVHRTNGELRFAICDRSASTNGSCDQSGDWSTATVDPTNGVGMYTSIAVDSNGDPMISYWDGRFGIWDTKFAMCDMSASTNGNCEESADWSTVTVTAEAGGDHVGIYTSIAVDTNGDPMISYSEWSANGVLHFAICDMSASTNGNCDQSGDWSMVAVDAEGMGGNTSIAVDTSGDPMISYHDVQNGNLKLAVCDMSASTNGNCDQTADWSKETVDASGTVGDWMPIAVDVNGNPIIAYYDWGEQPFPDNWTLDLKFATAASPDADRDGVPNGADNCRTVPNPGQANADADLEAAGATLAVGVPLVGDPDGDACDDEDDNESGSETQDPGASATTCPPGTLPAWADCVETYLGTDPLDNCSADAIADNEPVDALPPDINDDRSVNILDVFKMLPFWLGPATREDLNADGTVNILDVFRTLPRWLDSCT